jgi:hypothetical protein
MGGLGQADSKAFGISRMITSCFYTGVMKFVFFADHNRTSPNSCTCFSVLSEIRSVLGEVLIAFFQAIQMLYVGLRAWTPVVETLELGSPQQLNCMFC